MGFNIKKNGGLVVIERDGFTKLTDLLTFNDITITGNQISINIGGNGYVGDISGVQIDGVAVVNKADFLIRIATVFPEANSSSGGSANSISISTNKVAFWGDSFTAGGYGNIFGTITGNTTFNGGVNGETSTQIKVRFLAATDKFEWGVIIWAGRNNPGPTVITDIAAMVAALTHVRYLVLPIFNMPAETIGTAGYNTVIALNQTLATTYGVHYFDARAYLVSQYNPSIPQDVTDHNNDIIPTSLRNSISDQHLNLTGNTVLATYLASNFNTALTIEQGSFVNDTQHFFIKQGAEQKQVDFLPEVVASKSAIDRSDTTNRFIDITATGDAGLYYFNGTIYRKLTTSTITLFTTLTQNLEAYYTLNDTSGFTQDSSGNGHHATSEGNLTKGVAGKISTAFSFNGTNSQVNIPRFMNSNVFTVAAWIKTSSATTQAILMSSSAGSIHFRVNTNGTLGLVQKFVADVATSTGTVNDGNWHHVVITYNASGNYVFYIDGTTSGAGTNAVTFDFTSGSDGIGSQGGSLCFNGQIDEFGTWNRALTAPEVALLYNSGSGLSYPF